MEIKGIEFDPKAISIGLIVGAAIAVATLLGASFVWGIINNLAFALQGDNGSLVLTLHVWLFAMYSIIPQFLTSFMARYRKVLSSIVSSLIVGMVFPVLAAVTVNPNGLLYPGNMPVLLSSPLIGIIPGLAAFYLRKRMAKGNGGAAAEAVKK